MAKAATRKKSAPKTVAEHTMEAGRHRTFKSVDKDKDKAAVKPDTDDGAVAPIVEAEVVQKPSGSTELTEAPVPAIKVGAKAFHAALKDVLGAIEARSTLPILSHVLIEAGAGSLSLHGTDLDMWVRRELACEAVAEGKAVASFSIALPAKPLAAILSALEGDTDIVLEAPHASEVRAVLRAGRSRYKLACLPEEDFARPADVGGHAGFDIACSALDDVLASVDHAISTEDTRYYLNGVFVHRVAGQLMFAATDGHRLARVRIDGPDGSDDWPDQIWPRRALGVLAKLLAAGAKAGTDGDRAMVLVQRAGNNPGALVRLAMPAADGGDVELTMKTIDGTFPDYRRVIPTDPPRSALMDRAALGGAIRRVAALADEKTRAVKAVFTADKVELSTQCPDLGEARAEVPCTLTGGDLTIGFDAKYWLQTLDAMAGSEVSMRLGEDGGAPVLVGEPGMSSESRLLQVLMPLKV